MNKNYILTIGGFYKYVKFTVKILNNKVLSHVSVEDTFLSESEYSLVL